MKIVRHRDGEEQQNEREADSAPFLHTAARAAQPLMDPLDSPDANERGGDEQPDQIEDQFHRRG
jgi:hypothetical protein